VSYLQDLLERLKADADVRRAFGEPIVTRSKTLIPVARISYGFGGADHREGADPPRGVGGGGGVIAQPVGVIEISEHGTRYIPIFSAQRLATAFIAGFAIAALTRRKRAC
jgi:uncharacterized spore protein YtfJ